MYAIMNNPFFSIIENKGEYVDLRTYISHD